MYGRKHTNALMVLAGVSCAVSTCLQAQISTARNHLRIGVILPTTLRGDAAGRAVLSGIRLGAAEAKQTATLFGAALDVYESSGTGAVGAVQAATFLVSRQHVQVLVGTIESDADALSRFAEANGILFLNAASRSQPLRSACRRNTFHIEASDGMYANAARSADSVVLWASSLQRFGASQLNDRYRTMFRSGMNGSAWAGWAAVKVVTEAVLRAHSTEPHELRAYLEATTTQFDGHKGWPLSFRAADHQLRQPLYIVAAQGSASGRAGAEVRDVPDLRNLAQSGATASAVLDGLVGNTGTRCPWAMR